MPEPQDIAALRETAEVGDLLHDAGSRQDEGWFILGEDGYLDVDNATWCDFDPDDAPWTSEHFVIYGSVLALLSEVERGRALRAAVEALWKQAVKRSSFAGPPVETVTLAEINALLAAHVPSPLLDGGAGEGDR